MNAPFELKHEDGYELWLRYIPVADPSRLAEYRQALTQIVVEGSSPTLTTAREELTSGLSGLLGMSVPIGETVTHNGTLVVGTPQSSTTIASLDLNNELAQIGDEGFVIVRAPIHDLDCIVIAANTDIGALYGTFHFLRYFQMELIQAFRKVHDAS